MKCKDIFSRNNNNNNNNNNNSNNNNKIECRLQILLGAFRVKTNGCASHIQPDLKVLAEFSKVLHCILKEIISRPKDPPHMTSEVMCTKTIHLESSIFEVY